MKILVIVVAVFIILAGGTFGVMRSLQVGPFAPIEEIPADTVVPDEPSIFIDLEPLVVNVFQDQSVATIVQVTVKLETLGKENASYVNKQLPRITNALLQDLHSYLPRVLKEKGSRVDVFVLKKRMKVIVDRLYPEGQVHDVLIQSLSENS